MRTFSTVLGTFVAALALAVATPATASATTPPPIRLVNPSVGVGGPDGLEVTPDCDPTYPGTVGCGGVGVSFDLTGFDAYGGLQWCDPNDLDAHPNGCEWNEFGSVGEGGTARLHALIRCGDSSRTQVVKRTLTSRGLREDSLVGSETRRGTDAAHVALEFRFPNATGYGVCGTRPTYLLRAKVFDVTVRLSGQGGVASTTYRIRGTYRYDS